jgi:translation initiation factor 2B subunit (eIF-2B alpha/beta/delta family)
MEDAWATVVALAEDRDLGATDTTLRAARALARLSRGEVADAMETLLRGHPCMAPLWRLASVLLSERDHARGVEGFTAVLEDHGLAAEAVAAVLPNTVLTISWSATVARAIEVRRPASVVCMASDPGGEGARMAEAIGRFTDAAVLSDQEALQRLPAEAVLVGADAVSPRSVVNKVKTRELAEAAGARHIPCYAVAGSSKLVPVELPVVDPFQSTPIGAFTQIATPSGLMDPVLTAARAAAIGLHPALVMLAEVLDKENPDGKEESITPG